MKSSSTEKLKTRNDSAVEKCSTTNYNNNQKRNNNNIYYNL